MTWRPVPRGLHCDRHDRTFGRLEKCPDCADERDVITVHGDPYANDPPRARLNVARPDPEPPAGCVDGPAHERWFTAISDEAAEHARKFATSTCRLELGAMAKLLEVAIKARSRAADFTGTRERRAHVRWMAEQRRLMRSRGVRN